MNYGLVGVIVLPMLTAVIFYPIQVAYTLRYRAWDPWLDAAAGLTAALLAGVALWINPEARALLSVF